MSFLDRERTTLERVLPGLDGTLSAHSLDQLEQPDGTALAILRRSKAAGLLVPQDCGGLGADPHTALHVQRALGARAPSLAVASTMHHFSIATLLQYSLYDANGRMMLAFVAGQGMWVASAFAEGRPSASILDATVRAEWSGSGYRLKGSKKPCSLSRSMDLLSAGVAVVRGTTPPTRGVLVLPASTPGIVRRPFWRSNVLAATESDEVVLDGIEVSADAIIPFIGANDEPSEVELGGLCWFTLLISAAYLGIASGLVERVLLEGKGSSYERVVIASELEAAMAALEGVALRMSKERLDHALFAHARLVRYSVQDAIERATARAAELLGGLAFIRATDVAYLLAASRALAFHPPSRSAAAEELSAWLQQKEEGRRADVAA